MKRPGRAEYPVASELGAAIRHKRAGRTLRDVEGEIGVGHSTLSRIEVQTTVPSTAVARSLARWLGWSLDDVIAAAERPAKTESSRECA